jgi:hypothetical protein
MSEIRIRRGTLMDHFGVGVCYSTAFAETISILETGNLPDEETTS